MDRPTTIAFGIQRFAAETPTLPPATHTNSYAIGERDVLLVEPATPYEHETREWLAWARQLASTGRRLQAIVVTHHHADHVLGAELFKRELGLPIWAHEATAERLPEVHVERLLSDGEPLVLDGPVPQRWETLHTPGHAPGHVCLHEPELGALVVGDMVASEGTILIAPEDGDMLEYLRQLERLKALGACVALPAHGDPVNEPSHLFSYYVEHRKRRERKILQALKEGVDGFSPAQLLPLVYDDVPEAALALAALSLEAHLHKLSREGLASWDGERYRAAAH